MKKIIYYLILIFVLTSQKGYSQCNVQTITKDGEIATFLNPELVGSAINCEIGLSIYKMGTGYWLATTIRYFSSPKKTTGSFNIILTNGEFLELKFHSCDFATVEKDRLLAVGLFEMTKSDVAKLKKTNIKSISFQEEGGITKAVSVLLNSDVAKRHLNCLH